MSWLVTKTSKTCIKYLNECIKPDWTESPQASVTSADLEWKRDWCNRRTCEIAFQQINKDGLSTYPFQALFSFVFNAVFVLVIFHACS